MLQRELSEGDGWVTTFCGGIVQGIRAGYTAYIAPDKPIPGARIAFYFLPAGLRGITCYYKSAKCVMTPCPDRRWIIHTHRAVLRKENHIYSPPHTHTHTAPPTRRSPPESLPAVALAGSTLLVDDGGGRVDIRDRNVGCANANAISISIFVFSHLVLASVQLSEQS